MSTARRQSGRLASQMVPSAKVEESSASKIQVKPRTGSGKRKPVEVEAFDSEDSDEEASDVESDASEYGKQPVKRQKLKKTTSSGKLLKRNGQSATCYLTTIPLDVLLEIFIQLEPKDLILLARTNHAFRGQLLSRASNNIWKKARENIDGPDCPDDFSEQRWAHLLYAEAKCESCGARNIQRVDFGLRRRVCTRCLKANLVVTSSFSKHFPHLEDTILDLIPYTNIGGFAHGHPSRSKFYWKPDIENMTQKLAIHERDIHMRVIGARKRLEDFTAERIALVATAVEHAEICNDWSRQSAIRRQNEEILKCDQRSNAIKDKFVTLGYTEVDISCIRHHSSVRQTSQLTDRVWNKIYPELEPLIQATRDRRLKAERAALIAARTLLAEDIYKGYKKTLVPARWRYLPGLYEILQLPAFDIVVNAPDDVNVDLTHFKEAADALPGFVVSWAAIRKTELVQLIESVGTTSPGPLDAQDGLLSSVATLNTQSLDLATSVFACAQHPCSGYPAPRLAIIGWEAAAGHQCRLSSYHFSSRAHNLIETILKFSKAGSTAAASLVTLAALNEKQATCTEMDGLDLRFLCLACPVRAAPNNKQSYNAFSWRAAVSHFLAVNHSAPLWRLLNNAETQQVKADEGSDPTLSWSCNHCPQFLDEYHTFSHITDHVKAVHAIVNPTAPADLFRYLDLPRPPVAFLAARPPILQYRCKRCPTGSKRTFKLDGVQSHLKDKHKVLNPVGNQDWVEAVQS
ncbi:hypothetical protein DFH09DRAFT_1135288 [Mycena vulgaris]|nr:hypothetical protein DFH09DRAFT_1135288 [Mycena vulgaris]